MNLFIPKTIRVGYQERKDTYSGKLAYVIYYDENNKLRKEHSWSGWIKADLGDMENIPTEGFVLNKKVGGDSWGRNSRNTYTRVYDPRGFEFEISIENLLYILENCNSIKGKGLEGEFVYSWDGKDLVLLPVNASDYKTFKKFSEKRLGKEIIKAKELIIGNKYLTKSNKQLTYLGKMMTYEKWGEAGKSKTKKFIFAEPSSRGENDSWLVSKQSISKVFIEDLGYDIGYSKKLEELSTDTEINPIIEEEKVYLTRKQLEDFFEDKDSRNYDLNVINGDVQSLESKYKEKAIDLIEKYKPYFLLNTHKDGQKVANIKYFNKFLQQNEK